MAKEVADDMEDDHTLEEEGAKNGTGQDAGAVG